MKLYNRRMGAAALALILILSTAPLYAAATPQEREERVREKIARIIKSIKKQLGPITTLDDLPMPPKP